MHCCVARLALFIHEDWFIYLDIEATHSSSQRRSMWIGDTPPPNCRSSLKPAAPPPAAGFFLFCSLEKQTAPTPDTDNRADPCEKPISKTFRSRNASEAVPYVSRISVDMPGLKTVSIGQTVAAARTESSMTAAGIIEQRQVNND